MLTLQKTQDDTSICVPTTDAPVEQLLSREWLLTNNRGGYASSTIVGCNTRRYHGLLIGSLNPPVNRILALANCLETVMLNGETFNLSTFEFDNKFAPAGFGYIKKFRRDIGVHFDFQIDRLRLTKSVYILRDTDTVALVYDFTALREPVEFILRPFVGLRDFHTLQKSYACLRSASFEHGAVIDHDLPDSCKLLLYCSSAGFVKDEQWWFDFVYRKDSNRGQDFTEDLWTPGFFKCRIDSPAGIVLWANLNNRKQNCLNPADTRFSEDELSSAFSELKRNHIKTVCEDWRRHRAAVITSAKATDSKLKTLCLAADQFITKRQVHDGNLREIHPTSKENNDRTTIIAGFPWFADWGRDTFVSLPGLLLATGRFQEAKSVLINFAQAANEGMIPNRFDDHSNTAYFNSVDASLWFINGAFQYLNTVGDSQTFTQYLLPTIRWIMDSYQNGTRFGIHADNDGLIAAGNEETQLTWMDAKCDGVAFTPRHGKAVEINALWFNSLCCLAEFYVGRDTENARYFRSLADKVQAGFRELFWNESLAYLNDCILPDGSVDASLRPNQILAVSLPFSPLSLQQQKCVVHAVQQNLLTPFGLRTLSVQDSRYKGRYTGPLQIRDEAYHQGTVWPYLIGSFVEAYLKVNNFSRKSKRKAAQFIEPLMCHLTEGACLGQISEIFDGDPLHEPKGCFAQAWSVAELIRAYRLIHG